MEQKRLSEEEQAQFSLCVRIQEQLPDLLEGYLDAVATEAIRAHLSVCYVCSTEYREMRATIRLVETLPFCEPIQDHGPAIMEAIRAQAPAKRWWRWRPRFRGP